MKKIQLGILYGSRSCEHEVSVISALQLYNNVDRERYDATLVYISQQGEWFIGEPLSDIDTYRPFFQNDAKGLVRVLPDMTARSGALIAFERQGLYRGSRVDIAARLDCVIPVMHGLHGEDGTLQGLLEMMDIPYASTGVAGSSIGMDKIMMKAFFRGMGFPVLPGCAVMRSDWTADREAVMDRVEEALSYPVYVKPANLGSSIGVARADDRAGLADALDLASAFDRRILVERGLEKPVEVNCSVRGFDRQAEASVVEMPITGGGFLDFDTKYLMGGGGAKGMASLKRVVPAPIGDDMTHKVRQLSLDVFKALDCKGVVRVDYMIDPVSDALFITEINTIPGSLAFYLWDKSDPVISYSALIDGMVTDAFRAYEEKTQSNYAFRSDIFRHMPSGGKGIKGSKG